MLELRALHAWWGPAQALFSVDLTVRQGELVILQGLNGAGKSTLMQSIMGVGPRVQGLIALDGAPIGDWPAHRRANAGIGWVAEDRRLFTALTVRENLMIAARGDVAGQLARVLTLFAPLRSLLDRPAARTSGGEQQMLAVARCLMTAPRLMLLDEPCEGIAPVLVEAMSEALLNLRGEGMTLLVAEQNTSLASRADRTVRLVAGRIDS